MIQSPFKFLDSYTLADRNVFFGRDQEVTELYRKVFESRILLVYGVSGTGKSSIINCGLASRFDESDWLPVNIRRGDNIVDSLNNEISKYAITNFRKNFTFDEKIQSLYLDHFKPLCLIFDQFEELFIFGTHDEKSQFIKLIKQIVGSKTACRIIIVIREEYLAWLTEFEYEIPNIFSNRFRVEKMKRANAIYTADNLCKVNDIETESGFSEDLIDKLCPTGNEIELTYLQIYLDRIFRLASEGKNTTEVFSKGLLTRAGSVSDLLGQFLDEQIRELDDPEMAMAILKTFVSTLGTKKQMTQQEIRESINAFGKEIDEPGLIQYLNKFVDLRILREKDQTDHFELRHDALAAKIFEKITLVEKEVLEIRQFVENAYSTFEKRHIFLSSEDLSYIAPYEDKIFAGRKLMEFINNSRKRISAKKRAFNRILSYSAIGFFIIIISMVFYYYRSNISAKSKELTIESYLQKGFSPSLSFKTAVDAYSKDTTSAITIKAIFDSFYEMLDYYNDSLKNNPKKQIFNFVTGSSNIIFARFSKDGKYIYGCQEDNRINIWDLTGKLVFSAGENRCPIVALNLSPDNKFICVLYRDHNAIVWNTNGEVKFKTIIAYNTINPFNAFHFSSSGNLFAFLTGENGISIRNLEDSSQYILEDRAGKINGVVFSPDGQYIASASMDSSVMIWRYNEKLIRFEEVSKITGFNGPVWSVDFARNSKYVLCVSYSFPYPVIIARLTGDKLQAMQYFFKEDLSSPWLYSGKYYAASFTANDAAIRISTFSDSIIPNHNKNHNVSAQSLGFNYQRIIFSRNSPYALNSTNKYLNGYGTDRNGKIAKEKLGYYYSAIDVSAKYIVSNVSGNDFSVLYYYDRLPIMKFSGTQPCFSPDGNYLLCIDGRNLKLYPATERELIRLVMVKSIFGDLDKIPGEWRHFFKDR